MPRPLVVDVHSHVQMMTMFDDGDDQLISHEQMNRRDDEWRDKIKFMNNHGIDIAIVSIPDLDLSTLSPKEAIRQATRINEELQTLCEASDAYSEASKENDDEGNAFQAQTNKRLYAFGVLPLVKGVERKAAAEVVQQVQGLDRLQGVVLGTRGFGKGFADETLEDVFQELADAGLVAFVHPPRLAESQDGAFNNVLSSCFDLPFELTTSLAQLILSGALDRHPDLKLLVSYSAGALPYLSSRLSSVVAQNTELKDKLKNDVRYYLGQMWFDCVGCGPDELALLERMVARAEHFEGKDEELEFVDRVTRRSDLLADTGDCPGTDRILFGTDHARGSNSEARLKSVEDGFEAVQTVEGWSVQEREKVLGLNAVELFELE
ncbi:hypothetical protein ACM66B_004015 [Microbotryomycetes sp. NB124-2]